MTVVSRILPRDGRPKSLADHRAMFGAPDSSGEGGTDLIATVRAARLTGRGGASFPTATKLAAVAARSDRAPVVVINGCESEPASSKDKTLLRVVPHLVFDGAARAAAAVGARRVILVIERDRSSSMENARRAVAERATERGLPVELVEVPQRFVSGEEGAIVHHLNGGDAKPTATPPRIFERGVDGRPTLLSNVETFAHIAQIATFGAAWFREMGTADEPGTTLVTVSGAVHAPGVYEVPMGTSLRELVLTAGGATHRVAALLIGGYYGSWLSQASARDALLSNESLRPSGAGLGCGAVVVFPEGECGLHATADILAWLSGEIAGQCGPCVHGLPAIARATRALAAGAPGDAAVRLLHRWSTQLDGRGGCRMPDGAVRLVRSALAVFAEDVARHSRGLPCPAPATQDLIRLPPPDPDRGWR